MGGCFSAGLFARRNTTSGAGSSDRALELFEKSCAGGHGDGCLFAAQMIEEPYGPRGAGASPDAKVHPISDETLSRRDGLVDKACELGSADGCKRLGDVYLGKNRDKSLRGYSASCRSSIAPAECQASRKRLVDALEEQRLSCRRGVADACTRLGNVLYRVDAPRAVKLFVTEAQLRGVVELAGGMNAFVEQRTAEARRGDPFSELSEANDTTGDEKPPTKAHPTSGTRVATAPQLVVERLRVRGRLLKSDVQRRIELAVPSFQECRPRSKGRTAVGRAAFELVVDATGDVWRAHPKQSTLSAPTTGCLEAKLSKLGFSRPADGPAHVDLEVVLTVGEGADG